MRVCIKSKKYKRKDLLFRQAVKKLDKEFDIIKVIKSIRKIELLSSVILSKYQKFFLPALNYNILDHN